MRRLLLSLLASLLAACGTASSIKSAVTVPDQTSFVFQDERPLEQRSHRTIETTSGSIVVFGDEDLSPPAPQLLLASLHERLGEVLQGKTVSLIKFEIKVLDPGVTIDGNQFHASIASTPGGYAVAPLALPVIYGIEKMKARRTVLVAVTGSVDGAPFSTTISDYYRGRVSEANIQASLNRALEKTRFEIMYVQEILRSKKGPGPNDVRSE